METQTVNEMQNHTGPADLLDPKIKNALDSVEENRIQHNKDFPCLVTGEEGNGKSALSIQMADYVDEDFDIEEQVVMSWEGLIRTADELEEGQAIVVDEGVNGFMSREHRKKGNKMAMKWLREIRAKKLYIFILMPEYAEAEDYLYSRAKGLIRCVKQGWAHFFNHSKMNEIDVEYTGNGVEVEFPDPLFRASWGDPEGTKWWKKYRTEKKMPNINNLAEKYLGGEDDGDEIDIEEVTDEFFRIMAKVFETVKLDREQRIEFSKTIYNNQYFEASQGDIADIFDISKSTANAYVND